MTIALQSAYASDLDKATGRLHARHAQATFSPDVSVDPLVLACEYAERLEASLAMALREHHHDDALFARLYRSWEAAMDVRAHLCIDEPPTERAVHIHDAGCMTECGCGRESLEVDDPGFALPSKPVPHPSGGFAYPRAVTVDGCGDEVGFPMEW